MKALKMSDWGKSRLWQTLQKLHDEGWRVCGQRVWNTLSSFEQSWSPWIDVLQGSNKLEGVGQLSHGVGTQDHNHPRSKRFEKSCMGWVVRYYESPWSPPSK